MNLRQLGHRATLALAGIAMASMAVVALLNIGHNAKRASMAVFSGMGSDLLIANLYPTAGREGALAPGASAFDSATLPDSLSAVVAVAPLGVTQKTVRMNGQAASATILGSTATLTDVLGLDIAQGRSLSDFDEETTVAVLGAELAADWASTGRPVQVGERVQISGYLFEVVGILRPTGQNLLMPAPMDGSVLLPIASLRRVTNPAQISSVLVRFENGGITRVTADAVKQWLEAAMPTLTADVQVPARLLAGMDEQARLFSWLLGAVAVIALLAGGVGVMNVMLMSVTQRRCEVGVRMALGARPRDIAALFLAEASALGVVGALVGIVAGVLLAWMFVRYCGWGSFSLSLIALPLGGGSALAVSLMFGLWPALAAARLKPVQALRDV